MAVRRTEEGFSLVELAMVIAILLCLALLALPSFTYLSNRAKVVRAAEEIRGLEKDIYSFSADYGRLPVNLPELGHGIPMDPWGRAYEYAVLPNGNERYVVVGEPLCSDFDLFSKGADGDSVPAADPTAAQSQDDILRAGNGAFVGLVAVMNQTP